MPLSQLRQRMRATAIVLIYFMANLIGMGLGPLVVGMLSDVFTPAFGQESLRYALVAICPPGFLWMTIHLWFASKTVAVDLSEALEGNNKIVEQKQNKMTAQTETL